MNTLRKTALTAAVLAATVTGGAAAASMIGIANAQTPTTPGAPTTTAPSTDPSTATAPAGPHAANGVTETPLAGDELARVTAAVQAAEPGATIDRAETDADGGAFEAHITKPDGTKATVELDASFTITATQTGRR